MAKRTTIALAAAIALVLPAGADGKTIKSTVDLSGASFGPDVISANGNILSERRPCLSRRKVQIFAVAGGEQLRISTDVSSLNGYWGGAAAGNGPDGFRARMKPKRISERKRCSGDRDSFFLRPRPRARETVPGAIQYFMLAYAGDQVGGAGNVVSARRCLARRTLEVFDFDDGVRGKFRASDVSSRNGWWGAFGDSNSQGVRLKLAPKRLGSGDRCGGDTYSYDPDPNP
jgi:hypothetical protein